MGYNEREELEATKEWLLRINKAGFSEELEYVPSELSKLGVAPVDVVDRLDWLRGRDSIKAPVEPVVVEELVQQVETIGSTAPVLVPEKTEEELPNPSAIVEAKSLILDYDSFGPWEWAAGTIEEMIEEAIKSVLDPEPGLGEFNELSSKVRESSVSPLPRKGKRRRAAMSARTTS